MATTKPKSRPQRWMAAVALARAALDKARAAANEAADEIANIRAVQEEFEQWRDSLHENLRESATGQKLDAVCDIDLEPDGNDLDAMETAISDAEGAELPLGWGRD
jgi:hypothetical protein